MRHNDVELVCSFRFWVNRDPQRRQDRRKHWVEKVALLSCKFQSGRARIVTEPTKYLLILPLSASIYLSLRSSSKWVVSRSTSAHWRKKTKDIVHFMNFVCRIAAIWQQTNETQERCGRGRMTVKMVFMQIEFWNVWPIKINIETCVHRTIRRVWNLSPCILSLSVSGQTTTAPYYFVASNDSSMN